MSGDSDDERVLEFLTGKDFVSLLNCGFGLYSIYFFIQSKFEIGLFLLLLAVVMDILDGEIARRVFGTTEFGKRMDIADLVSFGVAPPIFVLLWLSPESFFENLAVHASVVFLLFAEVLRLARFQTRESNEDYFLGLPGTVSGLVYPVLYFLNPGLYPVVVVTFITSFLMLSSIKFPLKPKRLNEVT